jgi:hypothetical protein
MTVVLGSLAILTCPASVECLASHNPIADLKASDSVTFGDNHTGPFMGARNGKFASQRTGLVFKVGVTQGRDGDLEEKIVGGESIRRGDSSDLVRFVMFDNLTCEH